MYTYISIYLYTCIYVYMYIYMYIYTYVYTYINIHIYICTYIYMYIYIHTRPYTYTRIRRVMGGGLVILLECRVQMVCRIEVCKIRTGTCGCRAHCVHMWVPCGCRAHCVQNTRVQKYIRANTCKCQVRYGVCISAAAS